MKTLEQIREATKVRGFPKGMRTSTVTVSKSDIERGHAMAVHAENPDERSPYVEVKHNPGKNTFEIHTTKRDKSGSPTGPTVVKKHNEGGFVQHANRVLGRFHPDFYPPASRVQMTTNGKKFRFKLGR